jgi:hypothetical protein
VAGLRSPAYPGFSSGNTAGSFDGASSSANTGASLMNDLTRFTVMGWFNPGGPNGPLSGLLGQNDALELGYSDSAGVNLWVQLNGIWVNPRTGTNGFAPGQWYFVAAVADGTSVDVYVNGVERAHQTGGAPSANSSFGFNIGGGGIFGASGDNFNGLIEDVAIFDKALSQQQVQGLFSVAAGSVAPSILVQPNSQAQYTGRTAHFTAGGIGGTLPLTYRWQKAINSVFSNLNDGGNVSGTATNTLIISSVTPAEAGDYRLILSNAAGSVTSGVVALIVVQPSGTPYESAALALNPLAYWRLNETNDPSGGTVAARTMRAGSPGRTGSPPKMALTASPVRAR